MTPQNEEKVRNIVGNVLFLDERELQPEHTLEDLRGDSLDLIQIIIDLEDEFLIEIHDDEVDTVNTFGDILTLLSKKGVE